MRKGMSTFIIRTSLHLYITHYTHKNKYKKIPLNKTPRSLLNFCILQTYFCFILVSLRMMVFQIMHKQQRENFCNTQVSALLKQFCFKKTGLNSYYLITAEKWPTIQPLCFIIPTSPLQSCSRPPCQSGTVPSSNLEKD